MESTHPPDEILAFLSGQILFWKVMTKVNDHGKRQQRHIALNETSFHNIKKGFLGGYTQRRVIQLDDILGLVVNNNNPEGQLVLKVKPTIRNDYRFLGDGIEELAQVFRRIKPHLPIWTLQTNAFEYFRSKYPEKNEGMKDVFAMMKDKEQSTSANVDQIRLEGRNQD